MKRYLYILLSAVVMLAACEPVIIPETKPDVVFCFSKIEVETTQSSATIDAVKPYMTVDGVKDESVTIYLEYWLESDDSAVTKVEEYAEVDDHIIFSLEQLSENTTYHAHITIEDEYGMESCPVFPFTTKEHVSVTSISCSAKVAPKGLMATVNLSDIAYLVDGTTEQISIIKVEYSPASTQEWLSHEFYGSMIESGTMSVELPFEGEEYLEESSDYKLRVTLFPENSNYAPITANIERFTTTTAEVSATIPMPRLTLDVKSIVAYVEGLEIFYDGVSEHYYTSPYATKYQFRYRMAGTEEWSLVGVGAKHGKMEATLVLWDYADDTTYEVQAMVIAGADGETLYSDVATIKTPAAPTPPPVVGDGDTSDIAGTWHLTQWRGAEPSFDVYLSITEDGIVTLWQRIESREWQRYYSIAEIENGVISGTYTDGVAWGASYNVTLGNETMTWVNTADSGDISVYSRAELPEGFTPAQSSTRTSNRARFL